MAEYIGQGVFTLSNPVRIESYASVAGKKESEGPLGYCFDEIIQDSHFGKQTWNRQKVNFSLKR